MNGSVDGGARDTQASVASTRAVARAMARARQLWRGPGSCSLAACLRVRRCAWAVQARADTHSLASSIMFLVICIVSFVFVSIIVIISLRTRTTSTVDGMHNSVWVTHRRGQRRWRACLQSGVRARCVSGQPADGQPVASDSSTAAKLFDVSACCRVEHVHGWRGAHAWCVRVERALHACARVQGAEQRAWARHARRRLGKPGARHASINFTRG